MSRTSMSNGSCTRGSSRIGPRSPERRVWVGGRRPGTVPHMSAASRERLVRLVRRHDADLAEAALLCCVEVEPDLDVDAALLRLDALADGLRTRRLPLDPPELAVRSLAGYLGEEHGFGGDV